MDLSNYVTVDERLRSALERYPDLRIIESLPEVRTIGDAAFIEVTCTVYREPDDPLPAIGTAWEPFPGRTPYTRDSEMMNAATSALGRALGYMGLGIARSIASADEVHTAQERQKSRIASKASPRPSERSHEISAPVQPAEPVRGVRRKEPTEKMAGLYRKLVLERGLDLDPDVLADFDATKQAIDHMIASRD
jgi:hypothetical protein